MDYCTQGNHVIAPGTEGIVVRSGMRYCPDHVPEPEPVVVPFVPTERQRRRMEFQGYRYEHGAMDGDDAAEPPNELDRRLARHVLP